MPKNDPNPGDAAAEADRQKAATDEARRAEEQRKADEAKAADEIKARQDDEARKAEADQAKAEQDRREQSADAASPRGQAIARMVAASHLSEADAAAQYDATMASRDETTFLHAERAVQVPDATYGVTGTVYPPEPSPQNRTPDNMPIDGTRDVPRVPGSGPLPMPPYSPQNRPYDGSRPPQPAGGPAPPQFHDTAIAAGLTRPLSTVLQEGEASIAMLFDRPVTLTLDDHSQVKFPAGLNQVPEHLASHWYLQRSGAKRVDEKK